MSTSNQEQKLELEINCADSATEIFVIDGEFNLRDRGIGNMKTYLEPGLYKVKVRAGFETLEKHVILRDHNESVDIPPFNFVSPAPLEETSKTHESHMQAAYDGSRKPDLIKGSGSDVFIFSRDWTSDASGQPFSGYFHPGLGLSLRNIDGTVIADVAIEGSHYLGNEPWSSCNVQLNPGYYTLSLELSRGDRIEQTIVASEGWQTQIFLLLKDYSNRPGTRRADLQGAAILLAQQGQGFDPASKTHRLAELARLGLANRRKVLSEDVREMLRDKVANPMLGIFVAHLLLLDKEPDLQLFTTVITNLRALLNTKHPDVEALALRLDANNPYEFNVPPMLRKSWTLVVEATAKRPEIIPEDSLAAMIATRLWNSYSWLIWTDKDKEPVADLSDVEAILESRLNEAAETRDPAGGNIYTKTYAVTAGSEGQKSAFAAISDMRSARPKDTSPTIAARSMAPQAPESQADKSMDQPEEGALDDLVQRLNMPRRTLEKMIDKLKSSTDEPAK